LDNYIYEKYDPLAVPVLVTGGTGTYGAQIVRLLQRSGYACIANYFHNTRRAQQLAAETGCTLDRADAASEEGVAWMFCRQPFCHVVHCLGSNWDSLLMRQPHQDWQESLRINAASAFLIVRASLRYLPPGSRVVLISSRVGRRGRSGQSAYAAAKGALLGLARAGAIEGRSRGIAVHALLPGFENSALSARLSAGARDALESEKLIVDSQAGESLSACVLWLLSQGARNLTEMAPDCRI
jgi:NAD(P)-dependent dehydrogenase (short-subunit alcohol dehydrogenase family)